MSIPPTAGIVLDLLALFPRTEASASQALLGLRVASGDVRGHLAVLLGMGIDADTDRALVSVLTRLGVLNDQGHVVQGELLRTVEAMVFALDLQQELTRRAVSPASRLVLTSATGVVDDNLRAEFSIRPLFDRIEDVVRGSKRRAILGSPYWNERALDRLTPAVSGFLSRCPYGEVVFIAQGGDRPTITLPSLHRFVERLQNAGGRASLWVFDTTPVTGEDVLLHAKFALADDREGYLGSANMTGEGFEAHLEIGISLGPPDVRALVGIIDALRTTGVLQSVC